MSDLITSDEVMRIAGLARLNLDAREVPEFQKELAAILAHVRVLQSVDIEGVEPMTYACQPSGAREDEVVKSLNRSDILNNAPEAAKDSFRVPRVVEGGNS